MISELEIEQPNDAGIIRVLLDNGLETGSYKITFNANGKEADAYFIVK